MRTMRRMAGYIKRSLVDLDFCRITRPTRRKNKHSRPLALLRQIRAAVKRKALSPETNLPFRAVSLDGECSREPCAFGHHRGCPDESHDRTALVVPDFYRPAHDDTLGARVQARVRETMKALLEELTSGRFAEQWLLECQNHQPVLSALMQEGGAHPIEAVGRRLRAMMPWLSDPASTKKP